MMLFVFVRHGCLTEETRIENIITHTVKCGMRVHHKGACIIALQFGEEKLCFVNSHLAAHMPNVKDRNEWFSKIEREMGATIFQNDDNIREQYGIFWIGDLNYRIDHPSTQSAKENPTLARLHNALILESTNHGYGGGYYEALGDAQLAEILKRDQLTRLLRNPSHPIFSRYDVVEGLRNSGPEFLPTFKVVRGKKTTQYQNHRTASWCDRILVITPKSINKKHKFTYVEYTSHPDVSTSDHKPVTAVLKFVVRRRREMDEEGSSIPLSSSSATTRTSCYTLPNSLFVSTKALLGQEEHLFNEPTALEMSWLGEP